MRKRNEKQQNKQTDKQVNCVICKIVRKYLRKFDSNTKLNKCDRKVISCIVYFIIYKL